MAKMKHMKQPERPKRQPKQPDPPKINKLPPGAPPRPPRVSISRDRAFKAALAEEYGVTEVPRRLQRRTEKTLESLPDTLPVRHRPVLRAFRSMASAAAVLAVTFAAILGLNTTHPQLTEALPGLGSVFAAMNGHNLPDISPSPAPTPTPKPGFQPVTVLNKGDFPGTLVIDDAWTDGNVLMMEMSLSTYSDFDVYFGVDDISSFDYLVFQPKMKTDGGEYDSDDFYTGTLTVSSDNDLREFFCDGLTFTVDSSGGLTALWQLDLQSLEVHDSLNISLELPDMAAIYSIDGEDGSYCWFAGFSADFTLEVDSSRNRALSAQSGDGPVTLRSVDYAPGRVELDVSLPYLGMIGDLYEDSGKAFEYPLGSFATLTCMDGQYEYVLGNLDPAPEEYKDVYPDGSSVLDMHYVFKAPDSSDMLWPRDVKGPLTLTLYEFSQYDGPMGRVMAEFTIDLSTGRVYPSDSYTKYGFEKSDPTLTTQQRFENAMTNGLLLPPTNSDSAMTGIGYGPFCQFALYSDMSYSGRELMVYGLLDGTLERAFTFVIDGGDYEDSEGSYSTRVYTLPSSGQEYLCTYILINLPDWLIYGEDDYTPFDQLELVDPLSGEVLIPDLTESWKGTVEELLGGNPEQDIAENEDTASIG